MWHINNAEPILFNINNVKITDNKNDNLNKCYMTVNNFYPTQSYLSTSINIKSLSSGTAFIGYEYITAIFIIFSCV